MLAIIGFRDKFLVFPRCDFFRRTVYHGGGETLQATAKSVGRSAKSAERSGESLQRSRQLLAEACHAQSHNYKTADR